MARADQLIFDVLNLAQGPLGNDLLVNWMKLLTQLGSGVILILVAVAACIALAERQQYRRAVLWFVATALVFVLSAFLKQLFFASRPDIAFHLVHATSPSFPSGHALRSAFVYPGVVAALSSVYKFPKFLFMVLAITIASAIGLSRVMLGVHWPVDVLAGWAIGGGAVILWSVLDSALRSSNPT